MIVDAEMGRRLSGKPCILLLDIDGTLAPIAPKPSQALIPQSTRAVLQALAARPDVCLALVSGRAAADARRVASLSSSNVWIIGNHGIELADPRGRVTVHPEITAYATAVSAAAIRAGAITAEVPGTVLEDKRWTLSVHYRLSEERVIPELLAAVSQLAAEYGLRVTQGKKVAEIRPPVRVNKGTASIKLAERLGGLVPGSSGLSAGDDQTDEDAFAVLREQWPAAVTIRVGQPENGSGSAAEWTVDGPPDLVDVLEWLARR